ncbi:hypothetical protein KR018_003032, partial [Drosophila ironensis]
VMLNAPELERLCRICLRQLRDPQPPGGRLAGLLRRFLDIDLLGQEAGFPKNICGLCRNVVASFEELCLVARETSAKLREQLPGGEREESCAARGDFLRGSPPMPLPIKEELLEEEPEQEQASKEEEEIEDDDEDEDEEEEEEEELEEEELPENRARKTQLGLACNECGKRVYKLPYLEAHIRSVHQGHAKPFLCRSCDKAFTRYEQLRSHQRNAHKQQEKLEELRQLICELCNRQYSTKNALGEHLKRHAQRKEYVCEHCGVAKVTRTELLTHLRTHNPTWERFKCEQCPQLFRHKSAISRHVRVVHEGQRRFKCGHCEKRFGTHASQLRHEQRHAQEEAAGEAPPADEGDKGGAGVVQFACTHCQKACVTRQNLEVHLRRHSRRRQRKTHPEREQEEPEQETSLENTDKDFEQVEPKIEQE